jgi:uncharacterized protein (DUF1330 family)
LIGSRFGGRLLAIAFENEQTEGRRQAAALAFVVDFKDKFVDSNFFDSSNLLERVLERVFQTDAGLVTVEIHRSFYDRRFHRWYGGSLRFHSSITLVAAGASEFLILIRAEDRPDRYGLSRRLARSSSG